MSFVRGSQGEAVYIDTEGSFMEERAKDIASAFVTHVHKLAGLRGMDESIRNLSVHIPPCPLCFDFRQCLRVIFSVLFGSC